MTSLAPTVSESVKQLQTKRNYKNHAYDLFSQEELAQALLCPGMTVKSSTDFNRLFVSIHFPFRLDLITNTKTIGIMFQ